MAIGFAGVGGLSVNQTVQTQNITDAIVSSGNYVLIAQLFNKELSVDIQPPDGTWTEMVDAFNNASTALHKHQYAVFWKRVTSYTGGVAYTFTKDIDDNKTFGGVISTWSGVLLSGDPIDATGTLVQETTSDADNVTFPAYDPVATDVHAVFLAFYGNDLTTFGTMSGTNPTCTNRYDLETGTGSDASVACTSGNNDGTNIASRTWASASTADAANTGVLFCLIPEPAAAAPRNKLLAILGVG